jgi:hypothetical protein
MCMSGVLTCGYMTLAARSLTCECGMADGLALMVRVTPTKSTVKVKSPSNEMLHSRNGALVAQSDWVVRTLKMPTGQMVSRDEMTYALLNMTVPLTDWVVCRSRGRE